MATGAKRPPGQVNHGPCSRCGEKIKPNRQYFGPPKPYEDGSDTYPPDLFCSGKCRDKGVKT